LTNAFINAASHRLNSAGFPFFTAFAKAVIRHLYDFPAALILPAAHFRVLVGPPSAGPTLTTTKIIVITEAMIENFMLSSDRT
jgi:hypothetical protein